jgi:hypothetical protein
VGKKRGEAEAIGSKKRCNFAPCLRSASGKLMAERIQGVVSAEFSGVACVPLTGIAHSYAAWKERFGKKMPAYRKSATPA